MESKRIHGFAMVAWEVGGIKVRRVEHWRENVLGMTLGIFSCACVCSSKSCFSYFLPVLKELKKQSENDHHGQPLRTGGSFPKCFQLRNTVRKRNSLRTEQSSK